MRSEAWTAKAHQSGLGSYAELKHDTLLYSKQAVAEGGDKPDSCPSGATGSSPSRPRSPVSPPPPT